MRMHVWIASLLFLLASVGCMSGAQRAQEKENKRVRRLESQIADFEQQIERLIEEKEVTLERLRTHREGKLEPIRIDLETAKKAFFNEALDDVRIAREELTKTIEQFRKEAAALDLP